MADLPVADPWVPVRGYDPSKDVPVPDAYQCSFCNLLVHPIHKWQHLVYAPESNAAPTSENPKAG